MTAELQESEEKFRSLVENSHDILYTLSAKGRFDFVSPAWTALLGHPMDQVVGQPFQRFVHPDDWARCMAFLQKVIETGQRHEGVEHRVRHICGAWPWFTTSAVPLRDESGAVIGFEGTARDITERKRAEDARDEALDRLRKIARQVLGMVYQYRLRADGSSCMPFASEAIRELFRVSPEDVREDASKLFAISHPEDHDARIASIQKSARDLTPWRHEYRVKFDDGTVPICCSPCELVAETVSFMRVRAAAKQLNLQTELIAPLPATVLTDPLRLRQVLVNLLGNAIKFTDQGEIRLAVRLTRDGSLPRLSFDVIDTGIGMNAEQVGKLFKPFSQVDSSATRKFGGTGLGLCISKHLANALGGDIEVRSQPGEGTTFTLTIDPGSLDGMRLLPEGLQAASQSPPCAAPAAAGPYVLHGRILLAEDGVDNQRLLVLWLRKAGAEVTAVENGQLAVAAAWAAHEARQPFDVILMDVQMPLMDGLEATRQLRRRGYTSPIVALTAHAMAEDCQKCLAAGCSGYATKPIDRQRLLATVAPWAARAGTPDKVPAASPQAGSTRPPPLLYSDLDFAEDPELCELVDLFVGEMPDRIQALEAQVQSRDWNALGRSAHQLNGAAGTYGFGILTPYAAELESAVRGFESEERILAAVDTLLSLCRRMRTGYPDTAGPGAGQGTASK